VPTYVYRCRDCGEAFEVQQRITDAPVRQCQLNGCKGRVERVIQTPGIMFRGSGFHVNDYPNSRSMARGEAKQKQPSESGDTPSCATCPKDGANGTCAAKIPDKAASGGKTD
jgi:putative FmdB family regulatory protein